mgnify:CR=1 FL=1
MSQEAIVLFAHGARDPIWALPAQRVAEEVRRLRPGTLVIATGGIDLSVGAVMAIAGATAASMTVSGHSLPVVLLAALGTGVLAGLWNGILVAVLKIQPFVATLILMVAGRGVAQLITSGQIVTFDSPHLAWLGSGSLLLFLPGVGEIQRVQEHLTERVAEKGELDRQDQKQFDEQNKIDFVSERRPENPFLLRSCCRRWRVALLAGHVFFLGSGQLRR